MKPEEEKKHTPGIPLVPGNPQSEYNAMMERRSMFMDGVMPEVVPDSGFATVKFRNSDHSLHFLEEPTEEKRLGIAVVPDNYTMGRIVFALNKENEQRLRDFLNARA